MEQRNASGRVEAAHGGRRWRPRAVWPLGVLLVVLAAVYAALGVHALSASTPVRVFVHPSSVGQMYYKPTPVVVTVRAEGLSGSGHTPVAAIQYQLNWDPNKLRWLEGPKVGPGTPTPVPVLPSCANPLISTNVTATATPVGFVGTNTPTPTATHTPSDPTQTPEPPTITPTPAGYILVACFEIAGTVDPPTPYPSGVLGTFKFEPLVTQPDTAQLPLSNVKLLDKQATPVAPTAVVSGGQIRFVDCYDVNGDNVINIQDVSLVAARFGMNSSHPDWNPVYDVNNDGVINIQDISLVASAFGLTC
jgi:hypothetical protein